MGKKNYTKYSEQSENVVEEVVNEVQLELPIDEIVEDVVNEVVEEVVEEVVNEVVETKGIVTGCVKLNVREEASKDAKILCVLEEFEEVTIDTVSPESYEDFYKVVTAKGVTGYCMKKFINIK